MRAYHPGKTPATDQPRRTTDRTATPAPWLAAPVHRYAADNVPDGPGQPLAAPRAEAPGRLGADFSRVPVHTDSAARSAAGIGARAYTSGTHVVIDGTADRHALAHEWRIGGPSPAVVGADVGGTGLPDALKASIEHLSGVSLDDVQVHYHSSKPAQVQALAYTQGTDIHVGTGQEQHLAHEAWHVVQQKRGRVTPTLQAESVAFNDDPLLEAEADKIGLQAANHHMAAQAGMPTTVIPGQSGTSVTSGVRIASSSGRVVQRAVKIKGKRTNTYNNLGIFKNSPLYKGLIPFLNGEHGQDRVDFHLRKLFSENWVFENEHHFVEALKYDIQTKSLEDEEYTLQEQYMTRYGWRKRAGAA